MPVPLRRLLLHEWLGRRATPAASRASVLAVESLLLVPGSARRAVGGGWSARKEYDVVYLARSKAEPAPVPLAVGLTVPGEAEWSGSRVSAEMVQGFRPVFFQREAIIDADALTAPLEVRGPRPGDRLRPLGSPGTRKLSEVFIDLKVPARERQARPLVVCGERIVWVSGLVVAEEFKVSDDTRRFLRLEFAPAETGSNGN